MGCSGCSTGSGCGTGTPAGCKSNGSCRTGGCGGKLDVFDWLTGMERPFINGEKNFVEIRFKNTRKEFFRNEDDLSLQGGDLVAVEAPSGHDVGVVSLTGELVKTQMAKYKVAPDSKEIKKIYRQAKQQDIDIWQEAQQLEKETMLESRKLAQKFQLQMKISDVEYQGDKTKATFYYTAENRVDFRELIRELATKFRVRIEMKQIGTRQEAGRLGGIGVCGRELCCSTWLTDFRSVSTSAARYQQLSLNPLKLAGQCGKLKCCLNYELDSYMEAIKEFPKNTIILKTKKGDAYHQKADIFKKTIWYLYKDVPGGDFIPLSVERAQEIIKLNKEGVFPEDLVDFKTVVAPIKETTYENVVGQDSLTRFDKKKKRKQNKNPTNKMGNKSYNTNSKNNPKSKLKNKNWKKKNTPNPNPNKA